MAVTIAKEQLHRIPVESGGTLVLGVFLVTFDAAYPVGGEEVDLSGFMKQVLDLKAQCTEDVAGYVPAVDDTNFATARSRILMCQDSAPATASPLPEAPNGTDLSAVKVRCMVWGLG